ncbi:hypothetical protein SCMC78_08510 [Streptomyces sp. CMC78]|uniref:Secreted protein n=1 Tax=Streptomyces sp. CMC78 TaxID=3231512 RepID=A0AB33KBG8_9ACTN|nr:hypothetical protein [Streptomyces sp. ID01-9D]
MTPYRSRPRANAFRVRSVLTTLLLTVLTLVGGAATASGAAPALTARSTALAAMSAGAPAATTVTSVSAAPTIHRTGTDHARTDHSEPHHTGAVARAGHEQPRAAADPAQAPRAGSGRPYLLLHAPPPPHDALTPAPPGLAEPRAGVRRTATETFDVPGSRRGALPGVRGPPGRTTTGPTTGHPSCSASAASASRPH